jgi:CheY-like chemotaxis protein
VASTKPAILIVDDEFGLAEMLREMLHDSGYEVTLAINGRLALEILGEGKIDLVLTDMMMPVMDGPELAAAMRDHHRYRDTPIIMMTSLPTSVHQPEGLFDAVLRKPFTPDLLLKTMASCLAAAERDQPERSPRAKPESDAGAPG